MNTNSFRQIRDRRIPFKKKVTLILSVFSGSGVRSKSWLLYSLLHPTTKHPNRLIGDILVFPCTGVDTMADSSLRAGLRYDGFVNQLSWERPAQNYVILTGILSENGLIFVFLFFYHCVDFYHYRMDVYTHFQHTIIFKQLNWILHSMTPLKEFVKCKVF